MAIAELRSALPEEEIATHFSRARRAARDLVEAARREIELVACALLMSGTLSGGDVAALLSDNAATIFATELERTGHDGAVRV